METLSWYKRHLSVQASVLVTSPEGYDGTRAFLQSSMEFATLAGAKRLRRLIQKGCDLRFTERKKGVHFK